MSERRVTIAGGTFFLCLWLFLIWDAIDDAGRDLSRIAAALERAYPVEVAGV